MKLPASSLFLLFCTNVLARTLYIDSGNHDRKMPSIVSFQARDSMRGQSYAIHGGGSPVQVDDSGRAIFFLSSPLEKKQALEMTLAPVLPVQKSSGVAVKQEGSVLRMDALSYAITPNRKPEPMFVYQMQPGAVPEGVAATFAHGAHLHPVYSPSGKIVTGNHPPDHLHQRGIWFAWTHTEFEGREVDFWNMGNEKHGGITGEVRFHKLVKTWSGPVHGGFVSEHRWIDHTSGAEKDMLHETWEVTAYHTVGLNDIKGNRQPAMHIIDFVSTQTCASGTPVKLPKYHYGGLGVRGSRLWDPVDAVQMLTSNGDDRTKGDSTKAKWIWLGGDVDGKTTGITVLIHPQNFRFPQPLRLNPKNPQLCVAPSQDGEWSIEPGKPYVSRYRIIITDGRPDADDIERQWIDYADPVKAEVE